MDVVAWVLRKAPVVVSAAPVVVGGHGARRQQENGWCTWSFGANDEEALTLERRAGPVGESDEHKIKARSPVGRYLEGVRHVPSAAGGVAVGRRRLPAAGPVAEQQYPLGLHSVPDHLQLIPVRRGVDVEVDRLPGCVRVPIGIDPDFLGVRCAGGHLGEPTGCGPGVRGLQGHRRNLSTSRQQSAAIGGSTPSATR